LGAKRGGELCDADGFAVAGVVFPKPALGGEVVAPLRVQGEGEVVGINGEGAGAGGIDADADDLGGGEGGIGGGLCEGGADGLLEAEEVIARMLAGEVVVAGIEEDALLAAGVVYDGGAEFASVAGVDDEGAD
jgi:hypothetical protein